MERTTVLASECAQVGKSLPTISVHDLETLNRETIIYCDSMKFHFVSRNVLPSGTTISLTEQWRPVHVTYSYYEVYKFKGTCRNNNFTEGTAAKRYMIGHVIVIGIVAAEMTN